MELQLFLLILRKDYSNTYLKLNSKFKILISNFKFIFVPIN